MNMAVLLESGQLSVFMPFIIYDSSLPNNMCMIFTINEYDMLNRLATISGLPLSDLKLECDNGALTLHVSNDTMYHELGVYQRIGASMLVCILVGAVRNSDSHRTAQLSAHKHIVRTRRYRRQPK